MTNKQASDKQEKAIAKYLGWHQVKGSGSRPTFTGDVESIEWLGECKTHTTPNHKIHFDCKVWNKIVDEAAAKFRTPVYFSDDGSQDLSKTFVMFSANMLTENVVNLDLEVTTAWNFEPKSLQPGSLYKLKMGKQFVYVARLQDFKEVMWLC